MVNFFDGDDAAAVPAAPVDGEAAEPAAMPASDAPAAPAAGEDAAAA